MEPESILTMILKALGVIVAIQTAVILVSVLSSCVGPDIHDGDVLTNEETPTFTPGEGHGEATSLWVTMTGVHTDARFPLDLVSPSTIAVRLDLCYGDVSGIYAEVDLREVPILALFDVRGSAYGEGDWEGCKAVGDELRAESAKSKNGARGPIQRGGR